MVIGGENKDVEYMAPTLKNVSDAPEPLQSECDLWQCSERPGSLIPSHYISGSVLFLSSSSSSSLKVFPVLFSSCPSFEFQLKSHLLYTLPDICTKRLDLSSEPQSHPLWVLSIRYVIRAASDD